MWFSVGTVEQWFDDAMARVSGWYKRTTQAVLLVIAILLTISVNADTLTIAGTLWRDPSVPENTGAVRQRSTLTRPQDALLTGVAGREPAMVHFVLLGNLLRRCRQLPYFLFDHIAKVVHRLSTRSSAQRREF